MGHEVHPTNSNILGATHELDRQGTHRGLKTRHAQMIAIGGTIGTGLFVGSGQGLSIGGPLFLVLSYLTLTVLVYGIVGQTTELSSYLPIRGASVAYYATRYVSRSLGFALGWMYWYVFAITVPAEITATSLVINYWHNHVPIAVWITITFVVILALNLVPVRLYGEAEFWFASLKVFGIIGMIIMALVIICGGAPDEGALGFHYWNHPGPINQYIVPGSGGRLAAFVACICFSTFAFAFAPELLVVTGGEMQSPRRNLPRAGRTYFIRLILFYVLGVIAISCIVSSDNSDLLNGKSGAGSSPWAIAAREAGIKGLDSVINAVIVTSAWSAGNSYLYLSTRALYSMALVGNAPKVFTRCSRSGIPIYALGVSASISLLAYLNCASTGAVVFNWFVNIINTGAFESWFCISIIYLRFRKATFYHNITDLPFRSRLQPYLSWVCMVTFLLLMLLQGFPVFLRGQWNTSSFLTAYLGIPIFLALYFGHKFTIGRNDPWYHAVQDIDLTSGLDDIIAQETPKPVARGLLEKVKAILVD
ncbi:AAT family amino acid transporter [Myriangium duriaei CBS 260.36]|uniref:AAT family amino acid transporter n=1 Tax=Myriangium duriaei CBS 260.36 TaxID=1168546 RepID=A0A9P4JAQ9_9PEZI|nr:AAT family amino acid transporter [Myriangium duriaei CBS 260.36]